MHTRTTLKKILNSTLMVMLFSMTALSPLQSSQAATASSGTQAPMDTPSVLVPSGVTDYLIASPKVFWYTGVPVCPPGNPSQNSAQAPAANAPSASSANAPSPSDAAHL